MLIEPMLEKVESPLKSLIVLVSDHHNNTQKIAEDMAKVHACASYSVTVCFDKLTHA